MWKIGRLKIHCSYYSNRKENGVNNLIHYIRHNEVLDENWLSFRFVAWYCASRGIGLPKGRCHFGEIVMFLAPTYIALGLVFKLAFALFLVVKFLTWPLWKPLAIFIHNVNETRRRERNFASMASSFGALLMALGLAAWAITGLLTTNVIDDNNNDLTRAGWILLFSTLTLFIPGFAGFFATYWVYQDHKRGLQAFFALGSEAAGALRFRGFGHMAWLVVKSVPKGAVGTVHASGVIASFVHDGWTKMFCKRLTYRFDTSRYEPNHQPTES